MDNAELIEEVRNLQDRVDELEEQQSDNQPQPWSPTRRSLLGGLTGGGIGLMALLSASSPAAAATDQLGSPSRRIDFYGGTGDFTTLEAAIQTTSPRTDVSVTTGSIPFESSYQNIVDDDGSDLDTIEEPTPNIGTRMIIQFANPVTVINSSGNINLNGDTDTTPNAGDHLEFIFNGGTWYEVGRSV